MADALVEFETLDSDQIDDIMNGKAPREPHSWNDKGNDDDIIEEKESLSEEESAPDQKDGIGGPANSH